MTSVVNGLVADGDTPTAEALRAVAAAYQASGYEQGTVMLITDGESTCGDPCDAAVDILAAGFALQVYGVAFDSVDAAQEVECLRDVTDGASIYVEDGDGCAKPSTTSRDRSSKISVDAPERVTAEVGLGRGASAR